MLHDEYAGWRRAIARDPEDLDAWLGLARAVGRFRPAELPVDHRELERLLALWRRHPHARELLHLVLPLMGLELPRSLPPRPPRLWQGDPVIQPALDHWYHAETGHPVTVVRIRDQAPLVRLKAASPLYVEAHPVSVGRFRVFARAAGHKLPELVPETAGDPDAPVTGLGLKDALAYADWVRGFLADERLWDAVAQLAGEPPLPPPAEVPGQAPTEAAVREAFRASPALEAALRRPIPGPDDPTRFELDLARPLFEWLGPAEPLGTTAAGIRAVGPAAVAALVDAGLVPGRRLPRPGRGVSSLVGFRTFTRIDPLGTGALRLRDE